jgi:hypothetical protein
VPVLAIPSSTSEVDEDAGPIPRILQRAIDDEYTAAPGNWASAS